MHKDKANQLSNKLLSKLWTVEMLQLWAPQWHTITMSTMCGDAKKNKTKWKNTVFISTLLPLNADFNKPKILQRVTKNVSNY